VENLCEPFYLLMLQRMDMTKRVKAEGASIFVKSLCMYIFISLFGDRMGLLAFALA
jgi:surface polysaccharide O-acyltransferase-like enzyme